VYFFFCAKLKDRESNSRKASDREDTITGHDRVQQGRKANTATFTVVLITNLHLDIRTFTKLIKGN